MQNHSNSGDSSDVDKAITSLLQAIKELESQEPVAWRTFDGEGQYEYRAYEENESYADDWDKRNPNHKGWVDPLYTHPPQRTEQEPVQVSPLEFVEMVMEKEHLIGKPIFWAEWPNKEKNT